MYRRCEWNARFLAGDSWIALLCPWSPARLGISVDAMAASGRFFLSFYDLFANTPGRATRHARFTQMCCPVGLAGKVSAGWRHRAFPAAEFAALRDPARRN